MDAQKMHITIRTALLQQGTSEARVASRMGLTQQSLNRKLRTGTFRAIELITLLQELGYTVTATKGDDKITF